MHAIAQIFGAAVLLTVGASGDDAKTSVIRRAARSDDGAQSDELASEPVHCVVWGGHGRPGQVVPKGIKFQSKTEADATFKSVRRTETIAAHYNGLVETQRYMEPRLATISWRLMRSWCAEDHPNAEQPKLLPEDYGQPKLKSKDEQPPRDEQSEDEPKRKRHSRAATRRSLAEIDERRDDDDDDDANHDDLSERETRHQHGKHHGHSHHDRFPRNRDESSLDDDDEEEQPAFDSMHERRSRKRKRATRAAEQEPFGDEEERNVRHGRHSSSIGNLERPSRNERPSLQEQPSRMRKQYAFDGENHGQRPPRSQRSMQDQSRGHHDHNQVASSFLGKAGLAHKITSLGKDVTLMASEAAALSKRMGLQHDQGSLELDSLESETQGGKPIILKDRIAKVEGTLTDVHTKVSSLEREVLGESGNLKSSRSIQGLKSKVTSLGGNVQNMQERMAALTKEMDSVAGQLDNLETSVDQVSSKALTLLRSINDNAALDEQPRHEQDASFADRFNTIEGYAEKVRVSVDSLEAELRGGDARSAPSSSRKEDARFSDKVKSLGQDIKGLGKRIASLEREV